MAQPFMMARHWIRQNQCLDLIIAKLFTKARWVVNQHNSAYLRTPQQVLTVCENIVIVY